MGNCLKISGSDDISLLRGNNDGNSTQELSGTFSIYQNEPLAQPQLFYPVSSSPVSHSVDASNQKLMEDQIKIAKRIGLVQHLPIGTYDGNNARKARECVICMVEFCVGEAVRYLPCMHIYHVHCIDDWLMRSLTCPSCLEPVDAALLTSFQTT